MSPLVPAPPSRLRRALSLAALTALAAGCGGAPATTSSGTPTTRPTTGALVAPRSRGDYGREFHFADFRDDDGAPFVIAAIRQAGRDGFLFAIASAPAQPAKEILVVVRPVGGSPLRRCEELRVERDGGDEEHGIERVVSDGSEIRYRLPLADAIRMALSEKARVHVCDRQIDLEGRSARLLRRFVLVTLIRMEGEQLGAAGPALREVGQHLGEGLSPAVQLGEGGDDPARQLSVGIGASGGSGALRVRLSGNPASPAPLRFRSRYSAMRMERCAGHPMAFEADALLVRTDALALRGSDDGELLEGTLAWSDVVALALAESIRAEDCAIGGQGRNGAWQLAGGTIDRLQQFALVWLAIRAGAERHDQLEFFPSVELPPSQEGQRPRELEGLERPEVDGGEVAQEL